MAKVTIMIEDMPNNRVKIEVNPKTSLMMGSLQNGNEITSAEAYALKVVNVITAESKKNAPLIVPLGFNGRTH